MKENERKKEKTREENEKISKQVSEGESVYQLSYPPRRQRTS